MTYRGHIANGVIVFDDPVNLPEGATVQVQVFSPGLTAPESDQPGSSAGTLFELLEPVIGSVSGMPSDAASNVDHYLYGQPKQQ